MPKSTRALIPSGAALLILALLSLLLGNPRALARQSDPIADPTPAESTQEDPTPADLGDSGGSLTSGPDTANQIITIEAEQFGVGDVVRESDWCGLSLILSDPTSDKARNVAVRVAIKDDDGDTQYVTRTLALSMATRVRAWLYFRVPKQFQNGSVVTVSVHEIDANAPAAEDGNIQVGKQLSYARIACRQVLGSSAGGGIGGSDPTMAMMGVIGRRTFRLDQYELRGPSGTLPTAHEPTEVVSGLTPESLPDSWVGLAPFEVILWTEGGPEQLEESRRQALREWVNRGGHLVVVLPPVGSTWFAAANPIADLMPSAKVRRQDDQSLEPYRNLLTEGGLTRDELPAKTVVQAFEALPDTPSNEFIEVLSGPNGCVAARRLVGTGMVTVIGLDLGAGRLPTGLLAADAFWHRVLGKRFDIPTGEEAKNISGGGGVFGAGGTFYADGYISPEIAKQRAAGVGVLLGLLVFAAYWFVAGPGGFGALKWKKMIHHAWVGFFAATLIFTFIAWAGATALRPRRVEAQHLTYLTHVYGQPVQSARVWFSALLPEYGDKTVSIGRTDADTQWRQALTGWSEPIGNSRPTPFPDARGYAVDVRKLNIARVPARATIRQFQGDWLGGPTWTMPTPTDPSLAPRLARLESTFALSGFVSHKLPAELTNVSFILVTGEATEARARTKLRLKATGVMPSNAYAWKLDRAWQPGVEFDLAQLGFKEDPTFEKFIRTITPTGGGIGGIGVTVPSAIDPATPNFHTLAALYSMIPQPNWDKTITSTASVATIRRVSSQALDLGKWFTQPCLIIIGHIEKSPTPVPITIDGDPCPTEGRTVVRWIYPLASAPPKFTRPPASTPEPAGGTTDEPTRNEPN